MNRGWRQRADTYVFGLFGGGDSTGGSSTASGPPWVRRISRTTDSRHPRHRGDELGVSDRRRTRHPRQHRGRTRRAPRGGPAPFRALRGRRQRERPRRRRTRWTTRSRGTPNPLAPHWSRGVFHDSGRRRCDPPSLDGHRPSASPLSTVPPPRTGGRGDTPRSRTGFERSSLGERPGGPRPASSSAEHRTVRS